MNEDQHTLSIGYLSVDDGHEIYYQTWGNPNGVPVFFFHGGPISACKDKHKLAFDPSKHYVIFHDQRGCGLSKAQKRDKNNTAQTRVRDIEALRKYLNLNQIQLFGFSWGSTLALLYAAEHPKVVTKMLIGGVYTGTKKETENIFAGGLEHAFPEAWQYFIEPVPQKQRSNPLDYYADVFKKGTDAEKIDHLQRFSQLEPAPMSIDADYSQLLQSATLEIATLDSLEDAQMSVEWFRNNCYIPEGSILQNAASYSHIPTVILQGRFDLVCPAKTAHELASAIGPSTKLHMIPAAHKTESILREVQRAYTWSFLD